MARRLQIPLAMAAAVVVAEAAVLLLRPRTGVLSPAEVSAASYFTGAEIARAREFRDGQTALYLARVVIELGVLIVVARRPPQWLLNASRPLLAGAAAGAGLSVLTGLAALPVSVVARSRAMDVGLITQSWGGWVWDVARSWAIGALIAGAGAALAVALMHRFGRRWWMPASALVVAFAVTITSVAPVVLDPIFNKFTPLREGQTRQDVLELAREAGVDVGAVLVMDASKRTTAANAYVAGLGHTKRVVLYDTLLEDFTRDEVRLVVAHELAHVHHTDVPKGLLWVALVAPFGMFAAAVATRRLAPYGGDVDPSAAIPALALALGILVPLVTTVSNQLSRRVEARADSYALQLTGAPQPFIDFERRIAIKNVSDPDPPAWRTKLLATHPSTIDRIGLGVAFERGQRASSGR